MVRPSFLTTKCERRGSEGTILPEDLLLHYAEIYATRFKWEGTPQDMPLGFIERAIFFTGGIAPLKAFGEYQLIAAAPVLLGIYGQPVKWEPVPAGGAILPPNILKEHSQSKEPMMFCLPMAEQIRDLCVLMADAYNCLKQTIFSMGQPVIVQGVTGGEVNIYETKENLLGRKLTVPALDRTGIQASVLDLGGKDHTQNLISTINALDCEILARMGIKSAGTEKASGVTSEETVSITQELQLINQEDYELRLQWSEDGIIRGFFPKLKVRPSPGLTVMEYADDTDQGTAHMPGEGDRGNAERQDRPPQAGHADDGEESQ